MVTKGRTASDSSYGSTFKEVWSKRKRDMVFGSNFNPLATKFTGFSVCHPLYNDSVTLNMVRRRMTSCNLLVSFLLKCAFATFLLLPNWKGLNANAYMQIRKYPEHCTILGTIIDHNDYPGIRDLSQTIFLIFLGWKQYKLV